MATVDSSRTGVPSIYHVNCEIMISQGTTYCKKHHKSLCAMASRYRKHEQTDNHISPTESKHDCDSIAIEQPQKVRPLSLKVSVPITAYINTLASTVSDLQDRLKSYGDLPSGILQGYNSYFFVYMQYAIMLCLDRLDR